MVDSVQLRKVLGQFATGVTVVTTVVDGVAQGMTVNSFTSVSLDPPLVLFCADKRARAGHAIGVAGVFAISVLGSDQRGFSDLFAGKGTDDERAALLGGRGATHATGAPVLPDVIGYLDCKLKQAIDAGDHVIYLGEVVAAEAGTPRAPLLYYRGSYQHLDEVWVWRDRASAREKTTPFDGLVDFLDRMQNEGTYAALLDDVVAHAEPLEAGAVCLDIGCGAGRVLRDLAPRAGRVVGLDTSTALLERAKERASALGLGNVTFLEATASALPFEDASFDRVVISNVLFYLQDPIATLKEASRVLKPGGKLIVLEPSTAFTRSQAEAHIRDHGLRFFAAQSLLAWCDAAELGRRYDEARLKAELEQAQLSPRTVETRLSEMALIVVAEKSG